MVGSTGLAFDPARNVLYVASTDDNAIFAIANPEQISNGSGTGTIVFQDSVHLHGPLALAFTPAGNLLSSQGDAVNPDPNQPSEIVEFTPAGQFVAQLQVDSMAGAAFGLAVGRAANGATRLAWVEDATNALNMSTLH